MSEEIKLIVGLGNPGKKYAHTLHNLGFLTVDAFLEDVSDVRWQSKWDGELAKIKIDGVERIFLKPQSYMNLSGNVVRACMQFYKLEPRQMLVIHDEVDLEEGDVRLKKGGGAGGHNGLLSIFEQTGSQDFYRIRIGVGKSSVKEMADYLLEKTGEKRLRVLSDAASASLKLVFEQGFIKAQMANNTKPKD